MATPLLLTASKAEPLPGNLLSLEHRQCLERGDWHKASPSPSCLPSVHPHTSGGPASPFKGLIFNQKVQLEHLYFEKGTLLPGTDTGSVSLTYLQPAQRVVAPTTTNNLNNAVHDVGNFSFKSPALP